jgi:hypothetical protein
MSENLKSEGGMGQETEGGEGGGRVGGGRWVTADRGERLEVGGEGERLTAFDGDATILLSADIFHRDACRTARE